RSAARGRAGRLLRGSDGAEACRRDEASGCRLLRAALRQPRPTLAAALLDLERVAHRLEHTSQSERHAVDVELVERPGAKWPDLRPHVGTRDIDVDHDVAVVVTTAEK